VYYCFARHIVSHEGRSGGIETRIAGKGMVQGKIAGQTCRRRICRGIQQREQNIDSLKSLLDGMTANESAKYESTGHGGKLELIHRKMAHGARRAAVQSFGQLRPDAPKPNSLPLSIRRSPY
jgi:hypothetical protein